MRLLILCIVMVTAIGYAHAATTAVTIVSGIDSISLLLSPDGSNGSEDDQIAYNQETPLAWITSDGLLLVDSRPWSPGIFAGRYHKDPAQNANMAFLWETDTAVQLTFTPNWGESWSVRLSPGSGILSAGVPSGTGTWDNMFRLTISSEPVPEPPGLSVLGIGLIICGFGAYVRRSRSLYNMSKDPIENGLVNSHRLISYVSINSTETLCRSA